MWHLSCSPEAQEKDLCYWEIHKCWLPGQSCWGSRAHVSLAAPSVQTSCISSPCPVQGFTRFLSELLWSLCPPQSWMVLPFPQGGFIHSTDCPCLCGSAVFAQSLAPGVCAILRFMTVSLAYRSHHPTFAKLEGPTRQHLPGWWDNLSPSPFLARWMFPMLDIPHSVSGHTYLTFLLGFILYLSLSCLALLLLVLTSLSPNDSFPPCGISYVFLYLCIYSVLFPHFTQLISPLQPQLLATEKQMSVFPLSPRCQLC